MKLIIAGSRGFSDYELLKKEVLDYISGVDDVVFISGHCYRGADHLGELLAKEMSISVELYPAEWDIYGKSAGVLRNHKMAEAATDLIAFWDGRSKGTKHMINVANNIGVNVKVIKY